MSRIIIFKIVPFYLLFAFTVISSNYAICQECSPDALMAKYWQYRENFNRHFIMTDRDPSGCVNDGIGQQGQGSCVFSKAGFSLPATSINLSPNGGEGLLEKGRAETTPENPWQDIDCAGVNGISWDNSNHNYLDMGSETPHQLGWYWVVLATEYQLLMINSQYDEAQRTLEELFLALQAYRRLDMQAQCMARLRYDEIENHFEVENCNTEKACLCGAKYREGGHKHFDSPCDDLCSYTPQLDGYSGFYLREDATQALESTLQEQNEDIYNIDFVASDYAMSIPPCTSIFSPPCYLVHRQDYMSQDGMTGLMLGLAMIKRYIPEDAEVTTCTGETYHPLQMAINISNGLIDNVDDNYNNRIAWPMSSSCCDKEVFLSESEGGRLFATIHGFKKAADYIDDKNRHSNIDELFGWDLLRTQVATTNSNNAKFWLRLRAIGWDIGEESNHRKNFFISEMEDQNLDILKLINDLLYPGGANLCTSEDQAFFERLLCSAPCAGPCRKRDDYPDSNPDWPYFVCSNTPRWQGQGWETGGDNGHSRIFNGLDFMALYNIYMLRYHDTPQAPFTYRNPDHPPQNGEFNLGYITGSNFLCLDETEYYEAQPIYHEGHPELLNIQWNATNNLSIIDENINGTNIQGLNSATPSYVEAHVVEERNAPMFGNQGNALIEILFGPDGPYQSQVVSPENCEFSYSKSILIDEQKYIIRTDLDHCNHDYWFHADGPEADNTTFNWRLDFYYTGGSNITFLSGKDLHITWPLPGALGGSSATVVITLTIHTPCGDQTLIDVDSYNSIDCPNLGYQLLASPNPGGSQVTISITNNYTIPSEGIEIRFISSTTGVIHSTSRIFTNGEHINISNIPEGLYNLQTRLNDGSFLYSYFIISRI